MNIKPQHITIDFNVRIAYNVFKSIIAACVKLDFLVQFGRPAAPLAIAYDLSYY